MSKIEPRKASKLNEIDRKVLTVYADISLETGARIVSEAAQPKDIVHKSVFLKV